MQKMKKSLLFLLAAYCLSCSSSSESESTFNRPKEWQGDWKAEWETLPESYPGIEDMEFYMDGQFIFDGDSLTVKANGFPGCIFNIDTLSHTQSWYVSSDTLFLMNDPSMPGMTYKVTSKTEDRIKLQLMEDIFVSLTRQ